MEEHKGWGKILESSYIMKQQNSNQNVKVGKVVVFVKTFDYYHLKFNFGGFLSCPVKLQKNLKLKFKWKFNHGFIRTMSTYKVLLEKLYTILTLLRMDLFVAAHRLG